MDQSSFTEVSVMIKNIPRKFTTHNVLEELERCVPRSSINMVSVPWDRRNPCNLGFAFVNFVDKVYASHAWKCLDGQKWLLKGLPKVIQFQPARLFGLVSNIRHCAGALPPGTHPRHFPAILVDGQQVDFRTASFVLEQLENEKGDQGEVSAVELQQHLRGEPIETVRSSRSTTSPSPTVCSEGQSGMDVDILQQLLDWSTRVPVKPVAPSPDSTDICQLEQLLHWSNRTPGLNQTWTNDTAALPFPTTGSKGPEAQPYSFRPVF